VSDSATVYSFPRSAGEEVRATIGEFRGHQLAHVRIYELDHESGELKPTQRGVAVNAEDLPKLLAAVEALIEAA
jgi:hypothetical protein